MELSKQGHSYFKWGYKYLQEQQPFFFTLVTKSHDPLIMVVGQAMSLKP